MNGQGQLGPLTTPSFPEPIFHFHLHKQTHNHTENSKTVFPFKETASACIFNAERDVTFKPSTTAAAGNPVGFRV